MNSALKLLAAVIVMVIMYYIPRSSYPINFSLKYQAGEPRDITVLVDNKPVYSGMVKPGEPGGYAIWAEEIKLSRNSHTVSFKDNGTGETENKVFDGSNTLAVIVCPVKDIVYDTHFEFRLKDPGKKQ